MFRRSDSNWRRLSIDRLDQPPYIGVNEIVPIALPTVGQLVILTASRLNDCHYCIAAHSTVAEMQKVPADVIEAIRKDQPIAGSKLEALRTFTTAVVEKRAWRVEGEYETDRIDGDRNG